MTDYEKDGRKYVPYAQRSGNKSIVYFTRDLSPEGIMKVYEKINAQITGKVGVKLHTGEPHGPNIIPSSWVRNSSGKNFRTRQFSKPTPIMKEIATRPHSTEKP